MKISLLYTRTYVGQCDFDLPDTTTEAEIREAIENLTRDDFDDDGGTFDLAVIKDDLDITGKIQPHTPKLNP